MFDEYWLSTANFKREAIIKKLANVVMQFTRDTLSYFPPSVMAVSIPKKSGGIRILSVPTVSYRIAQQVVRSVFEPQVAPLQTSKTELVARDRGTPQGGVISPILSNLFLHYAFDLWMKRQHPNKPWCRYADDGLIHCQTQEQAQGILGELRSRFKECGLELHPEKTCIVYCKDEKREENHEKTSFDFLGYTFRGRQSKSVKYGNKIFQNFRPAVSQASLKAMRKKTRELNWRNRSELSLEEIAKVSNPVLQGWLNYYGAYYRSGVDPVWHHFNRTLVAWAMKKYKWLKGRKSEAVMLIDNIARKEPKLFVHWRLGIVHAFV